MDWSIPWTFYPTVLSARYVWALFLLACVSTAGLTLVAVSQIGAKRGLLLAVPIAVAMLATSMVVSMVVTFFVHDI